MTLVPVPVSVAAARRHRQRRLRAKGLAAAAVLLGVVAPAATSYACSASETQVYQSATTVWCVEASVITKYGAFPQAFFPYGENVIKELAAVFNVPAQGAYTFEASVPNGSAHTGSECCGLGVTVTGDAFYGSAYGATGFWGYLLSLHETINDWTGQVSGGWPTDFWADHISAYPNSMDWHLMATLGQKDNDPNLTAASSGQKARFYPGGDSVDPRVPMFDTVFDLPGMSYAGWSRVFGFVESDKIAWDNLGVPNPDEKRSEYVAAYVSLGAGKSVLPILQGANVCNGSPDGVSGDATYTCQEANIDAVATAHCSIAAAAAQGKNEAADLAALRSGDYAGVVAKGACGSGCPAECGCKAAANLCVAPWLGDPILPDGGTTGGGDAGSSGGGSDAGLVHDAGGLDAGHDAGGGGSSSGASSGGASGAGPGAAPSSSGCSCRTPGDGPAGAGFFAAAALAALALLRPRVRRR